MKRKNKVLLGIASATVVAAGSLTFALTQASAKDDGTSAAKKGTASYHDVDTATAAGFEKLIDKNGVACIDDPAGGMGIHYVKGDRVGNATEVASEPEVLVYEPQKNGKLKLVAVEYVVTKDAWQKAGNTKPPVLFGREFTLIPEGNRYGLPDFYELHAWVWAKNPSGMFNDWNPKVSCQYA